MYSPLGSWVGKNRKKKLREHYQKQAAEREAQRAAHIEQSETAPKGIQRQDKGLRSTRDRS